MYRELVLTMGNSKGLSKYVLISNYVDGVATVVPKKKDIYVNIYKNRHSSADSTVIICRYYIDNREYFANINNINSYNVYIKNLDLLETSYSSCHIRSFRNDLEPLDKLVVVHFNTMKIMNVFNDYLKKISIDSNYQIIKQQIQEESTTLMDCYYQICIQKLRPQLVNFSYERDKLRLLFQ